MPPLPLPHIFWTSAGVAWCRLVLGLQIIASFAYFRGPVRNFSGKL